MTFSSCHLCFLGKAKQFPLKIYKKLCLHLAWGSLQLLRSGLYFPTLLNTRLVKSVLGRCPQRLRIKFAIRLSIFFNLIKRFVVINTSELNYIFSKGKIWFKVYFGLNWLLEDLGISSKITKILTSFKILYVPQKIN